MDEEKIKKPRKNVPLIVVCAICTVLFASLCTIGVMFVKGRLTFAAADPDSVDASAEPSEIDEDAALIAEYEAKIDELTFERDELQRSVDEKEAQLVEFNLKLDELEAADVTDDEAAAQRETELRLRIEELEGDVKKLQDEVDAVDEKIEAYKSINSLNIGAQAERVSELFELFAGGAPMRKLYRDTTETDKDGKLLTDDDGEILQVEYEQYPHVALYYEDVVTGYTITYNGGDWFFAASIIKTPYIYSVLREISDFEQSKYNFTPKNEGDTNPNLDENGKIIYLEGEEKYDLSRTWVFDRETMDKEGTGKIKDMDDGVEMTYKDLFRYAVEYSDNIAFAELRELFGYDSYYKYASALGVSASYGFMQVTAKGMGRFNRAMYDFMENDTKYGAFLKEMMLNANYRLLIPYAVSPKTVAHKYGWDIDSYHDTAIVYDKHPYILVILTDMDTVGDNENAFIRKVAALIDDIHEGYYNGVDKSVTELYEQLVSEMEKAAAETGEADGTE